MGKYQIRLPRLGLASKRHGEVVEPTVPRLITEWNRLRREHVAAVEEGPEVELEEAKAMQVALSMLRTRSTT